MKIFSKYHKNAKIIIYQSNLVTSHKETKFKFHLSFTVPDWFEILSTVKLKLSLLLTSD